MTDPQNHQAAEARFRHVFAHLGAVVAYARRRGSTDADSIGAEVMAIAWRRLADVPRDDPRPWLFATARNLLLAESRRWRQVDDDGRIALQPAPAVEPLQLDPQLADALSALSPLDREALLLVAWEDLTPAQAARSLGINPTAFRVRLLRARRRLKDRLAENRRRVAAHTSKLEMERT
jgi:RNA polymerase sigma-70 factor, ECF subfamily